MASLRDRIRERARRGLNRIQDQISAFEESGGREAVEREARMRLRRVNHEARTQYERARARFENADIPLLGKRPLQVQKWYQDLGLRDGASVEEVRQAYRHLMRSNHPDRFAGDPESERQATERSQDLTVAYEGLLRHLGAKPPQR